MKIENPLVLSNLMCFSIYACSREFTKLYTPILKELNITYPQYLVMVALWEHEPLSVKQLGNQLCLDSGTLTPLLKRLEEAGLVIRKRSQEDERSVLISLTDKGTELKEKAKSIPAQIFEKTGLTLEQFEEYSHSFKELLTAITKKKS
ncbi:DNA-binding transcriptional regulator, MarR family [Thermoactinomyces sp. DSM 45891]|uniref:MarR family winged helix-turn-helix transcriptional regulator n=1 Tax=Thermoactinomyces sp. DSM 45891 TaxID=1761907 RepID=UPI000922808D|nr:MarR family transcriptional regulator [Thermoactinomyces sp. DSM 45891]SFX07513.1 DNA-binding transcriptional regulator, MarR family [Thermoactinomyces sp. DSM 45891]